MLESLDSRDPGPAVPPGWPANSGSPTGQGPRASRAQLPVAFVARRISDDDPDIGAAIAIHDALIYEFGGLATTQFEPGDASLALPIRSGVER